MRLFVLNWILVIATFLWLVSSILLLISYNFTVTFTNEYYPAACLIKDISYTDFNTSAIVLLEDNHDPQVKSRVTVLTNYPPQKIRKYMDKFYPLGGIVGCLRHGNSLSIHLLNAEGLFIAGIILYILCAVCISCYVVMKVLMHRRRLQYIDIDSDSEFPDSLALYQTVTIPTPDFSKIKIDFAYAQKVLWDNRENILPDIFQNLVDLQITAMSTGELSREKTNFKSKVYKCLRDIYG